MVIIISESVTVVDPVTYEMKLANHFGIGTHLNVYINIILLCEVPSLLCFYLTFMDYYIVHCILYMYIRMYDQYKDINNVL